MTSAHKPPEGGHYIFRPWRKLPDGTVIYAKLYGLKAFKIFVPDDPKKTK